MPLASDADETLGGRQLGRAAPLSSMRDRRVQCASIGRRTRAWVIMYAGARVCVLRACVRACVLRILVCTRVCRSRSHVVLLWQRARTSSAAWQNSRRFRWQQLRPIETRFLTACQSIDRVRYRIASNAVDTPRACVGDRSIRVDGWRACVRTCENRLLRTLRGVTHPRDVTQGTIGA